MRKENKTMKIESMLNADATQDQVVQALMRFRRARDEAQVAMMRALMWVERHFSDRLASWGLDSFDGFVKHYDFCRPDVYRDFVAGCEAIGNEDLADSIGVEAVRLAPKVPEDRRPLFLAAMQESAASSGKLPSSGAARYEAGRQGMVIESRALSRSRELDQLRAENKVLRSENAKLRRENGRLKAKLGTQAA